MREGNMVVCDIVEEMDLILAEEKAGGNGVYRSIAPAFIEEAAIFVKSFEKVKVRLRTEPVEIPDLEVGPLNYKLAKSTRRRPLLTK